jgi:hypothetical protein
VHSFYGVDQLVEPDRVGDAGGVRHASTVG